MSKLLIDIPELIETKRLYLQMPKAGLGNQVYDAIKDGYEDYVKWLGWSHNMPTPEAIEEDCRQQHGEFILRQFIRYIIIDKETSLVIGRIGLPPLLAYWEIPQFGISYFIRKSQRSKGYATEATHALTLLAFQTLKAKKIEVWCDSENLPSIKVPLKLGFEFDYKQRGRFPRYDGTLVDLHIYSLFSENNLLKSVVTW